MIVRMLLPASTSPELTSRLMSLATSPSHDGRRRAVYGPGFRVEVDGLPRGSIVVPFGDYRDYLIEFYI